MCLAPGCWVGPFATSSRSLATLKGVTRMGTVRLEATLLGTPTSSMPRLGSAVMTVRAEKSTRFPMRFPRIRPSFPLRRCCTVLSARPERLCVTCGTPLVSLSMVAATLCCSDCSNWVRIMLGSPLAVAWRSAMLDLTTLTYWCVRSSSHWPDPMATEGRTCSGGTGSTVMSIHSGRAQLVSRPSARRSASLIRVKISRALEAGSMALRSALPAALYPSTSW
mmetsp:Transcript_4220/g.8817  ORF Transcript_4220/g.8817 Transcript_4220/m.8817 type:complete len:222 (+) Transcript_4220:3598-4263(+)